MKNRFLTAFLLSISVSCPALSSSMTVDKFDDIMAQQTHELRYRDQELAECERHFQDLQEFSQDDYMLYPSQVHKSFATDSFDSITNKLIAGNVHGFHTTLILMNVIDVLKKGLENDIKEESYYQDSMRKGFLACYLSLEIGRQYPEKAIEFCQILKNIKVNVRSKNKRKKTQVNLLKASKFSLRQKNTLARIISRNISRNDVEFSNLLDLFKSKDSEVILNCRRGIVTYFQQKFSVDTDDVLNQGLWERNPEYLKSAASFGHLPAITKCLTLGVNALSSNDVLEGFSYLRLIPPIMSPDVLFNLAQIYHLLDKEELAITFYERLLAESEANPLNLQTILTQKKLAFIYGKRKQLKKSISLFKNPADQGDTESMSMIAQAYLEDENVTSTDLNIVKNYVMKLPSDDPEYVRLKALYYQRLGNTELAKLFYGMAAEKGNVKAMNDLGLIFSAENDCENAIRYLSDAMENNHPEADYNLASLYCYMGKCEEAETIIERLNDRESEYFDLKGKLEFKKQNLDLALEFFEKASQMGDVVSIFNMGVIAFNNNDYDTAIDNFNKFFAQFDSVDPAITNYALGYCYYKKNDYELAVEYFLKAIDAGHNDSHLMLAETHIAMGNNDQAHASYKAAIELGVQDAELLYRAFLSFQPSQSKGSDSYFDDLDEDSSEEATNSDEESLHKQDHHSSEDRLSDKSLHGDAPFIEGSQIADMPAQSRDQLDITEKQFGQLDHQYYDDQEKYVVPELTKRAKRLIARAEKARERKKISLQSNGQKKVVKTYKDVMVSALPKIVDELRGHPLLFKIKGHLSHLANGDKNRGKFEKLAGYDNVWSTRLDKGNRLVFQAEWNKEGRLKEAKIISVDGHYKRLDNVMKTELIFKPLIKF